ncbi:hypothetical protein PENSPDRAFT_754695 [Peniophora sp. CONT]|nr:hypothetical protein PENSPDRAFT_754695 [Peniophora sp. CONT]
MALTVHVLHTLYPDETQPETPSDDAALLSQACALVDYDEWRAPLPFRRSASSFALEAKRCVAYAPLPPSPSLFTALFKPVVLKNWDEPISPSEIFQLHDLDPFDSTDMGIVISALNSAVARVSAVAAVTLGRRARSPSAIADKRPMKRVKLNETDTLLGLLPMPHFVAGPRPVDVISSHEADRNTLKPFRRTYTPIAPYTAETIATLLSPNCQESLKWIVPLRGTLPWAGCTRGLFTGSWKDVGVSNPKTRGEAGSEQLVPAYDTDGESVTWSPDAARQLWSDLRDAVRQEGTSLGKATLSFRGARRPRLGMCAPLSPQPGDVEDRTGDATTNKGDTLQGSEAGRAGEMRRALDEIDHIAVYCDAWRAPIVQELLYIWQYESRSSELSVVGEHGGGGTDGGGPSAEGKGPVGKVRMLKGARLVLVDGLGQGVLTYA